MEMRIKPTRDEKMRVVEAYHQSGLSQKEFAEKNGMPLSQLNYWNKEYAKWTKPMKTIETTHVRVPAEPDWRKLYEDERAKNEALQKVILVLGYQL